MIITEILYILHHPMKNMLQIIILSPFIYLLYSNFIFILLYSCIGHIHHSFIVLPGMIFFNVMQRNVYSPSNPGLRGMNSESALYIKGNEGKKVFHSTSLILIYTVLGDVKSGGIMGINYSEDITIHLTQKLWCYCNIFNWEYRNVIIIFYCNILFYDLTIIELRYSNDLY